MADVVLSAGLAAAMEKSHEALIEANRDLRAENAALLQQRGKWICEEVRLTQELVALRQRVKFALTYLAGPASCNVIGETCPQCSRRIEQAQAVLVSAGQAESLEHRVEAWVRSRIGDAHMHPRERAMRLLEEAVELAQSEGITFTQAVAQAQHVFNRPSGKPEQEAAGVVVCLLGWCAATGNALLELAVREIERIEAKPISEIRGSVARKSDADLVVAVEPKAGHCGFFPHPHHPDTCEAIGCGLPLSDHSEGAQRYYAALRSQEGL